jgi:zinc transport system substrate-binding protein
MRIGTILIVAGIAASLAPACAPSSGGTAGGKVAVVASFYPLYEAVQKVGGSRVQATNLTPAGAEPHDLELSPKQVDEILDATVVLYLGQGFQPAVQDIAADRHDGVTVDVLGALSSQLRKLEGEGGVEGGTDPHVWLDPVLMEGVVDAVRTSLSRADPAGAATYRRNADRYRSEIEALDRQFRDGLRDCDRRVIVTSHSAFGYLADRYGLVQEAIAGISPEAEPDPRRLAELADLVRREGATTIFTEELVSPRVAQTLAREAGARTAVLNPLEGLTPQELTRGENYVSGMRENLATLREALGCR